MVLEGLFTVNTTGWRVSTFARRKSEVVGDGFGNFQAPIYNFHLILIVKFFNSELI